jgi:D-alanyl-D-alanine dipeptidase
VAHPGALEGGRHKIAKTTPCKVGRRTKKGPAQRRWRNELVAVLAQQGFVNYSKAWWHFPLPGPGGEAYDLAAQPRRHRFLRIP